MATLDRKTLLSLARAGAEARIRELQGEISKLRKTFGAAVVGVRAGVAALREGRKGRRSAGRKRGKLSAAGRRAIIAAQKARWAKFKKAGAKNSAGGRKRRKLSAAARAKIAAAQKARWAKVGATKGAAK